MKKIILLLYVPLLIPYYLFSQNVGIGTNEPLNKLQVQGNLLVTTPTRSASNAPTVAQTKTMVNASTISFLTGDSTGRIYDPGGPAGNYIANLLANADIPSVPAAIGIEVTAETMGLGTGDSLIIKETSSSTNYLLAVGNGYTTTGKWVFNSSRLYIIFKSNADASTGSGFSLLFKRLYDNSISLPDLSGETGNALLFDTKTGYFRSGYINNAARGYYSAAFGFNTIASGDFSFATGTSTTASGFRSTAMGDNTNASGSHSTTMGIYSASSGEYSTAMGASTTASGDYSIATGNNTIASGTWSTAMGAGTTASGNYSTAMGSSTDATGFRATAIGFNTTASGDYSTAMGSYVSTNSQDGSLVIGDHSTTTVLNSANANNFRARFDGGYRFFTSANLSTGCTLFAGDNAWTTGSDVRSKENFAEVNGEDFLKKISRFHLTSWNYKTQDPKKFRHYGPMAQDFYAAFGKDKYGTIGNDTTINSADFAGVSFIAMQALEKRTSLQQQQIDQMNTIILQLRKELDELKQVAGNNHIKHTK